MVFKKIRRHFYMAISIVFISMILLLSVNYIERLKEVSTTSINKFYNNIIDLKKQNIEIIIKNIIKDIEMERHHFVEDTNNTMNDSFKEVNKYIHENKTSLDNDKLDQVLKRISDFYPNYDVFVWNKDIGKISYSSNKSFINKEIKDEKQFKEIMSTYHIKKYEELRETNLVLGLSVPDSFIDNRIKVFIQKKVKEYEFKNSTDKISIVEVKDHEGSEKNQRVTYHSLLDDEEGLISIDEKDGNGKLFRKEQMEVINSYGEGFVDYYENKEGSLIHKLSYSNLYERYNWIVSAEIDLSASEELINNGIDNLRKQENEQFKKSIAIAILGLIFLISCTMIIEKILYNRFYGYFDEVKRKNSILQLEKSLAEQRYFKMKTIANIDPLTKIYNRRISEDYLEKKFTELSTDNDNDAIILGDIDNFKKINDSFGHIVGDKVLVAISKILKSHTRESDIICRWGGEEFLIILKNVSEDSAFKIVEKLRIGIEELWIENKVKPTMSFGISSFSHSDSQFYDAINRADKALYFSKNTGKNKTTIYKNDNYV